MVRRSRLGAASLVACAVMLVHGCFFGDSDPGVLSEAKSVVDGEMGLELRLPDGSEATRVDYIVMRAGMAERAGSMPANESGHIRMQIGKLPPATGYMLLLHAERGSELACEGSAPFTVTTGETTRISLFLQCGTLGRPGNVALDGTLNYCPSAATIVAAKASAMVGGSLSLHAEARDEDPVSFAWSAPSGTFSAPRSADANFTCSTAGDVTVTVTVSDSQGCTGITSALRITCSAAAGAAAHSASTPTLVSGPFSSLPPYLIPIATGVRTKAILTSGDSANSKPGVASAYRMVGMPDGLATFDNDDGTFTLLSNHELGNTSGVARAHGGTGAFVSRWRIRKSDLGVLHGEDLIQSVLLWDPSAPGYVATPKVTFARFCAADLAEAAALYHAPSAAGFAGRLLLNAEESGSEGRAFAHLLDGSSYELPRLGKASWENVVASPFSQAKTIVVALDDAPLGQLYVYVGMKRSAGREVERAGLTNGSLFGVVVMGNASEPPEGITGAAFSMFSLGNVENSTGAALEASSQAADVTRFNRPEDGAWDPQNPRDFYFVTTNGINAPSRLWRLRFSDITQPELGGTLEMLLDGSEGQRMLDNLAIDARGHIVLEEDPNNSARVAQIWRYTIESGALVAIAQHNPALFTPGGAGFLTQDEEASGVIDATRILGAGWWLTSDQIHLASDDELVEGGQYSAIFDPGTL